MSYSCILLRNRYTIIPILIPILKDTLILIYFIDSYGVPAFARLEHILPAARHLRASLRSRILQPLASRKDVSVERLSGSVLSARHCVSPSLARRESLYRAQERTFQFPSPLVFRCTSPTLQVLAAIIVERHPQIGGCGGYK